MSREYSHEEIVLAAKKGAYWLDQVYPEWFTAIDTSQLDLQYMDKCVLGQIAGNYSKVASFMAGVPYGEYVELSQRQVVGEFMEDHGFNLLHVYVDVEEGKFDQLTEAWKREIGARLDYM